MSITSYLSTAPLFEIEKYSGKASRDGIPFKGFPKQHPFEPDKLVLVVDPLGENPTIIEFKSADILHAEDLPSMFNEAGEGVRIVKLWIRKGALGVIHEPFEVQDPVRFLNISKELHERLINTIKH